MSRPRSGIRLVLALIVGLVPVGFMPISALAQGSVIDLELGGEGAVSWNISNIKPGDTGVKTVTLHNAGSADGFVTIWISDIVSSEGDNPDSEAGDTAEPGELIDHLLFNLSCNRLSTNLGLPSTINHFPHSSSDVNYIKITSLNAGETVSLSWEWELPPQTGNEAQGDSLSFTINYMLEQFPPDYDGDESDSYSGGYSGKPEAPESLLLEIDVCGKIYLARIDREGVLAETVEAVSPDGTLILIIPEGTALLDESGNPVTRIDVTPVTPPASSDDTLVVVLAYDFQPPCTFNPPVVLTLHYDPQVLSSGIIEENLAIAYYDSTRLEWITLPSLVDTEAHLVTASLTHFCIFGLLAPAQGVAMTPTPEAILTPPPAVATGPTPKVNARTSPEAVSALGFNLRDYLMIGVSTVLLFGIIVKNVVRSRRQQLTKKSTSITSVRTRSS